MYIALGSLRALFCGLCVIGLLIGVTTGQSSAACSADDWRPPVHTGELGIQALLKNIELGTKWVDLPNDVRSALRHYADDRLSAFRSRWAATALAAKERILQDCPTPAMSDAMNEFYRKSYDTVVPPTFALSDLTSTDFRKALVTEYLAAMAAERAAITYPAQRLRNLDWDGVSLFDSVRLPDRQTYEDIQALATKLVTDLKAIAPARLNETERKLRDRVLYDARAIAEGGFSGDSKGGFDMESACELIGLNGDLLSAYQADHGRPSIFASDDEVLREANAIYLPNTSFRWLDLGTWNAAKASGLCNWSDDDVIESVGDPKANEVAKGILLLKAWWVERTSALPEAQNECSIYQPTDRARIWDAFSADQRFNNDGTSSMEGYQLQVEDYRREKVTQYRGLAKFALAQVFPDNSVLKEDQRAKVLASIDAASAFGQFQDGIAAALDAVQGETIGSARSLWETAFKDNVVRIGGHYSAGEAIRPDDDALFKNMFAEVKHWVSNRYRGYPIEIAALLDKIGFVLNTTGGAETNQSTGQIKFGIGTARSKMEYYSLMLHELRHAVVGAWLTIAPDKSTVVSDAGTAVEGSGVATEDLLVRPFMRETLRSDLAYALYALGYGLRDARFTATTEATLKRYLRSDCSGADAPNTIDFVKRIAASFGLEGNLADTLAVRSHVGTQYFQYISAGIQVLQDIGYLQSQIDPTGKRSIDPFVLFSCGLNNPRRDRAYIAELKECMKL